MCGFVGVVRSSGRAVDLPRLAALAPFVARRGPDGTGTFVAGEIGLLASRLAVQGGSEGNQPLCSRCGRFVLVYNGELFASHRRRLRGLLRDDGAGEAAATGDTELLLAYLAHRLVARPAGEVPAAEVFEPLRGGMYAFAVADLAAQEVVLHADPEGIKPLYLRSIPGTGETWFSSTRAPLYVVGGRPEGLCVESLAARLVLPFPLGPSATEATPVDLRGSVVLVRAAAAGRPSWPTPLTHAPAGARVGGPPGGSEPAPAFDADALADDLEACVRETAETAGPIAVFLSGGLDSAAAAVLCGRPDAKPITGRFAPPGGAFDESDLAAQVAGALALDHEVVELADRDLLLDLPAVVDALEEPLGGPGSLALHRLTRRARAHGRVALSGTGGDEHFAGYARIALALGRAGPWTEGYDALAHRMAGAGDDPRRRWLAAVDRSDDLLPFLHPDVRRRVPIADAREAAFAALFGPASSAADLPPARALVHAEVATSLRMLLLVEDRVTMAQGLESRPTLSFGRVAAAAAALPEGWLVGVDGEGKRALRTALEGRVPEAVRLERKKRGFPTPFHRAATGAGRDVAADLLHDPRTAARGWWDVEACRMLLDARRPDHDRALFSVLLLETWARRFVDGEALAAATAPR